MGKFFASVSTQLEKSEHEKFYEICKKQNCSPYKVLRNLVLDYVESIEEMEKENGGKGDNREESTGSNREHEQKRIKPKSGVFKELGIKT